MIDHVGSASRASPRRDGSTGRRSRCSASKASRPREAVRRMDGLLRSARRLPTDPRRVASTSASPPSRRRRSDAWWEALTAAGHPSDGAPGPRPGYGPDYYGAFVLDAAGNSVEAVHNGPRRQPGVIDHLWLRTRDLEAASRFYEAVCPPSTTPSSATRAGRRSAAPGRRSRSSKARRRENLHLAFEARDRQAVDDFHRAGVEAGYASNGEPGERPEYHPGYYRRPSCSIPTAQNIEAVFHDRRVAAGRPYARRGGACGGRGCRRRASRRRSRARSRGAARRRARPPS